MASIPAPPPPSSPTGFPPELKWRAIGTALLVILLGALDQTIVTIAVPTMARELGDVGWMAWVVSSYLVAATVVTPLYGRYGDQHGRRRALQWAILLFTLASVACAMAQTMPQLVWARVAQGIGGGGLLAGAQALIAEVVPLRERGRFQGWIAGVWAFANVAGPVLGGLLTHQLSWHWVFWINLPLCAVALWQVHTVLKPLARVGAKARFDVAGALWLVLGLVALLVPVTRIGQGVPWQDPLNSGVMLLCVPLLALFVRHEARTPVPLVPLSLLRIPAVAGGCAIGFMVYAVMITLTVIIPLRAQWVQQVSVDASAWRLMCMSMGIPFAATLAGRYMHRHARVRPLLLGGTLLTPLGLLGLVLWPLGASAAVELPCLFLIGMGLGLQLPAALVSMQHAVDRALIGTVTSLSGLFRQLGGAIGLAVLSALLLGLLNAQAPAGQHGGLEALVATLSQSSSAVDRQALDSPFRAVLWGCLAVALTAPPLAWKLPETALDATPH